MSTRPNDTAYHRPVMLAECLAGLGLVPGGRYVDVTFGGGGHSARILEQLTDGHLYSFDQDEAAERQASELASPHFTFIRANFRHLTAELAQRDALPVDGLLADLGVSSHQFDTAERGFSTRFDGRSTCAWTRTTAPWPPPPTCSMTTTRPRCTAFLACMAR